MQLHFISTGKAFPYPYYLAVMSALKTQKVEQINLWITQRPAPRYFEKMRDTVTVHEIQAPDFPALRGKPESFVFAHVKDYLARKILYEHGGIFLDLDTFCLKNMSTLADAGKDVIPMDVPAITDCQYPFNNAILIARKGSPVLADLLKVCEEKLQGSDLKWGDTGPIALSDVAKQHLSEVYSPPFATLGGFGGNEISALYRDDGVLRPNTLVVHMFAVASGDNFSSIDEKYIAGSNSLYARLVKQVLTKAEWDTRPELHFVNTGTEFPYAYFLALQSALNTQNASQINLWLAAAPSGKYFDAIKDKVHCELIHDPVPAFPALQGKDANFQAAHLADFYKYKLVHDYGGVYADLDSLSLSDYCAYIDEQLVGDKEVLAPLTAQERLPRPYHFSLFAARKNSKLVWSMFVECCRRLSMPESFQWGDSGPHLFNEFCVANPTKVAEAPYGMLGGCLEMYQLYTPTGKLPDNIRFVHLWANASDGFWTGIDEQYIDTSDHLYARLVRGVLAREERQPWAEAEMTVGRWLFARGQHYAAMFDVLKNKDCRHIMEIGTYDGQNALLMIKTAARRVPEEDIAYYGFDVFEDYSPEIEDLEFSVGYKPPKASEVEEYLKKHTTAGIHLFRGKSRETLSHEISHLPKMDFIYVDGGHSIETIRKDWWYVQQLTTSASIVVFDDYYDDMPFIGCKFLVGELGDKYQGQLMREADEYAAKWGKLKTQLFMVRQRTEVPGPIIPVRRPVLHVLGLAHTQTSKEYNACAYTSKTLKFCGMLKRLGYEVIHYGAEGSNPDATENVEVLSTLTQRRCYGDYDWKKEQFRHDPKDLAYQTFNKYAIVEINKRKGPRDILCITMGNYQKPIADGVQLTTVETGIGYTGIFCDKRIFESYAWLNYILGVLYPNSGGVVGPFNYDCVIPNFFEPSDFEFRDHKDDYYLFMGRLMPNKGVHIAFQTCERIGAKLKIAGQGTIETIKSLGLDPAKVEFVGYADTKMRSELMSHAKAIFVPTLYLGPFEGVAIEANFSGTPSICTPFGVFAETIQHGKTGFRCHTMDDFVFAAKHVDELDPYYIHDYAVNNYSVDRVGLMYDEYFTKVQDLWYAGWYEIHPERTQLDWLKRWHEHGDDSAGVPGRVGVSCDGLKK